MHARHRTLGALTALALGSAAGHAGADAAIKAQEGSVDHWIEYYARERAPAKPPAEPRPDAPQPNAPQPQAATEPPKK